MRLNPFAKKPTKVPDGFVLYAIGDIHGRADLLRLAIEMIKSDPRPENAQPVVIFLGDYIDRGPDSNAVLDILSSDPLPGFETRFLKGNHDAFLISFLVGTAQSGQGWLGVGGAETLAAYGVEPPLGVLQPHAWSQIREALKARIPISHLDFLVQLELTAIYGRYLFVHAGVRPGRPLHAQDERDLLEIREPFLSATADYDYIVVHGHTPTKKPYLDHRRLGLDTGAFASGILTIARLEENAVNIMHTSTN